MSLVFLPPSRPERQQAARVWPLVDVPVANKHVAALDDHDAERCRRLDPTTIRPHTDFHWWPRPTKPS